MESSLEELFSYVIRLSSAQRLLVLAEARKVADKRGDTELATHIERAVEHETEVRELESQWARGGKKALYVPEMKPLDTKLDQRLAGFRDIIHGHAHGEDGEDADQETVTRARELLDGIMPAGVAAIARLPYVDQATAVEDILDKLRGEFAGHVAYFGLTRKVARLASLSDKYSDAVRRSPIVVNSAKVQAAQARGHRFMLESIVRVFGMAFDSDNPEHMAEREGVFLELQEQMAQTRARKAARLARQRRGELDGDTTDDIEPDSIPEPGDTSGEA